MVLVSKTCVDRSAVIRGCMEQVVYVLVRFDPQLLQRSTEVAWCKYNLPFVGYGSRVSYPLEIGFT